MRVSAVIDDETVTISHHAVQVLCALVELEEQGLVEPGTIFGGSPTVTPKGKEFVRSLP